MERNFRGDLPRFVLRLLQNLNLGNDDIVIFWYLTQFYFFRAGWTGNLVFSGRDVNGGQSTIGPPSVGECRRTNLLRQPPDAVPCPEDDIDCGYNVVQCECEVSIEKNVFVSAT